MAVLAQTTLSHRDWEGVVSAAEKRWPEIWSPDGAIVFRYYQWASRKYLNWWGTVTEVVIGSKTVLTQERWSS